MTRERECTHAPTRCTCWAAALAEAQCVVREYVRRGHAELQDKEGLNVVGVAAKHGHVDVINTLVSRIKADHKLTDASVKWF